MSQASKVVHLASARPESVSVSAKGGYICLFRSLQGAAFASRPEYLSAWVHMLLMATHKPHRAMLGSRSIELQPGQFISGRKALAALVGVTEKQMRTILDFMVDEGMLAKASSRVGTVFTILNFEEYQGGAGQRSSASKASSRRPSSVSSCHGGPTKGQEGPTVQGQHGGQVSKAADTPESKGSSAGRDSLRANLWASPKAAKRATKQENNNSTSSTVSASEAFPMRWDWQPGESFSDRCRQAGIDLSNLEPNEVRAWVGEFRSYWSDRADTYRQGHWEHKLVQQLRRCLARKSALPLEASAKSMATQRREQRAAISAATMDIQDTSW